MLPIPPPVSPMLARAAAEIPAGDYLYEPKWDGFRAIVFRDGAFVHVCSRNGQALERYFPEVVDLVRDVLPERCVVDGELIVPSAKGLDFDALQCRIHPAASRIARLAVETPASFVAFDLLALGDDDFRDRPFFERRERLERAIVSTERCFVTPQTDSVDAARAWFRDFEGAGCDGVIARPRDVRYLSGERALAKIKHGRTADCVVGGFRDGKTAGTVGALLLGLYDDAGVLHYIGHTSSFSAKEKRLLVETLQPYFGGESFGAGRSPGAVNRWTGDKDVSWRAVAPSLVCEVKYDYLQGPRFRHGATFLRWRRDKTPAECTFVQLEPPRPFSLATIVAMAPAPVVAPRRGEV